MNRHQKIEIEKGLWFVIERNPVKSYELFSKFVRNGTKGLCITRTHPKFVKESYSLQNTHHYWLSTVDSNQSIHPKNTKKLLKVICNFINGNGKKKSVIFIDGIECLIVFHNLYDIIDLLRHAERCGNSNGSFFIIPLDAQALPKEEYEGLCQRFNSITLS